jgi:hypothetical protein
MIRVNLISKIDVSIEKTLVLENNFFQKKHILNNNYEHYIDQ